MPFYSHDIAGLALEISGAFTFVALGVWVLLRGAAWVSDRMTAKAPKSFPISAQKWGFAQNLGAYSVIQSESEYRLREGRMGLLHRTAKVWWPLVAWASLTQFIALYGARGIANELEVSFYVALAMTCSALGALGLFRKRMVQDHLRESFLTEGKALDWDAEAYVGGLRLRARFEGRPRKVILSRDDQEALSKDRSEIYYYHGIGAQPEAAHIHGAGLIVSEFRMLESAEERMTEENWLKKIKLRDALASALSAYVVAKSQGMQAVALLEYPGAVIMVSPLAEHVQYLESVADRLKKRKRSPTMSAHEVSLAAGQEFYSRFDERKVAELLAHHEWVSRDKMPL